MNVAQEAKIRNPLEAMRPGEEILFELRRHPIGIIIVYLLTGIVLISFVVLYFMVRPSLIRGGIGQTTITLGLMLFTALAVLFDLLVTIIYWGNRWIMTSDSITQVNKIGLFHQEVSQLAIENIEDVTAQQNNIVQRIFDYGTLNVETAGEQGKFVFRFAPRPTYYGRIILEAHEQLETAAK